MLENLSGWEFMALILLALLIFGDRLPKVLSDGLRMLRNLRAMARNATGDLSRELGTDIQLEDLHPRTFIRKHLISEAEEEALRKPLQGVYDGIRSDVKGVQSEIQDVTDSVNGRRSAPPAQGDADSGGAGVEPALPARAYDVDAT